MSTTLGFYRIKQNLIKYYCWPFEQWYNGLGGLVWTFLTLIWVTYPSLIEFMDYQANFSQCLFHTQFTMALFIILPGFIQPTRYRNQAFETFNLLSKFNQLGVPRRLESVEKMLKIVLKIVPWCVFLFAHFITYLILLDDNCAAFKTIKDCLILQYYAPFDLKPWNMTLLILLQIFCIKVVVTVIIDTTLTYYYSLELLIIRVEHLNEMIDGIILTRNKEINFRMLRPIIIYHQHIFRLFKLINDVFTSLLIIPQKIFALCILTLSSTTFFVGKDLISFIITIFAWLGMFLTHVTGQRLTTAGDNFANAVYNLNWYDADVVTRKQVLTLLCLSQRPLIIRVPLFGEMSHAAALTELKKVYVFINSLLAIKKNNNF